jgi:RNA polymerase sigma factor (sigma-70 family)
MAGAPGGMPVIAPMPAARPARIPSQRDGAESAQAENTAAAGTTVDHLTETYRAHYRSLLGLAALPDMASAEEGAYDQLERDSLIRAMKGLQRRQREVLVLRYFADMTEAQVAETLGISLGSVKAYGSRGIAALRVAMEAPA